MPWAVCVSHPRSTHSQPQGAVTLLPREASQGLSAYQVLPGRVSPEHRFLPARAGAWGQSLLLCATRELPTLRAGRRVCSTLGESFAGLDQDRPLCGTSWGGGGLLPQPACSLVFFLAFVTLGWFPGAPSSLHGGGPYPNERRVPPEGALVRKRDPSLKVATALVPRGPHSWFLSFFRRQLCSPHNPHLHP